MSSLRSVLGSVAIVGFLGLGFGLWFAMAPTEDRRTDLLKTLPESNPMKMEDIRKKNALMLQVLKDAAESKHNMARDLKGPSK